MRRLSQSSRGFTLIELLVVVFIFAIIAGMLVGSLKSDPHRKLENSAQRFVNQLELMGEEAVLLGWEFGLRVDAQQYSFLLWDEQQAWISIPIPEYAQAIELDEVLSMQLELKDDLGLNLLTETNENLADQVEDPPQVIILSSGEFTPFSLSIESLDKKERLTIHIDAQGNSKIERENRT